MAVLPTDRPRRILKFLIGATVALAAGLPVQAHIVPLADMMHGILMTPVQCAAIPQTVWIDVKGRAFCMRYYLSTAGGEGLRPLVFLQGDKLGRLDPRHDRERGALVVERLHWEPGARPTRARLRGLDDALANLAARIGATSVERPPK